MKFKPTSCFSIQKYTGVMTKAELDESKVRQIVHRAQPCTIVRFLNLSSSLELLLLASDSELEAMVFPGISISAFVHISYFRVPFQVVLSIHSLKRTDNFILLGAANTTTIQRENKRHFYSIFSLFVQGGRGCKFIH